jgi:hypothetical protein
VLIGAHYDNVIAAPSADDNAAAVAIALSAAAALKRAARARDVVVALFDAEEPPYFLSPDMGSVRFCEDQADTRGCHAAIIMDLVALVDACPRPAQLPLVLVHNDVVGDMSDHHAFRLRNV